MDFVDVDYRRTQHWTRDLRNRARISSAPPCLHASVVIRILNRSMTGRFGLADHGLLPEAVDAAGELDQFRAAKSADGPGGINSEPRQRGFDGAGAEAQCRAGGGERLADRQMGLQMLPI